MAQHMREDAGVPDGIMNCTAYTVSQILQRIYGPIHERGCWCPDGIMNCTAYTRSQILWRTSKLED